MSDAEPSLREQLRTARAQVEQQIDALHARAYPYNDPGLVGTLLMFMFGWGSLGGGPPFRTNGVMTDNSDLVAKLTNLLNQIDDALEELGSRD